MENETHSNVLFRPAESGTVAIIGATQDEHNKKLQQLKDEISNSKNAPVIEENEGTLLPLPGQISQKETTNEEINQKLSFENELEKGKQIVSEDNTIIFIIIGVVVAVIVGIIIKLKKN